MSARLPRRDTRLPLLRASMPRHECTPPAEWTRVSGSCGHRRRGIDARIPWEGCSRAALACASPRAARPHAVGVPRASTALFPASSRRSRSTRSGCRPPYRGPRLPAGSRTPLPRWPCPGRRARERPIVEARPRIRCDAPRGSTARVAGTTKRRGLQAPPPGPRARWLLDAEDANGPMPSTRFDEPERHLARLRVDGRVGDAHAPLAQARVERAEVDLPAVVHRPEEHTLWRAACDRLRARGASS